MKNLKINKLLYINPFLKYNIYSLDNYLGVNKVKREIELVVSISSNIKNFDKLPATIYSILNQNIKPDRFILWLDENECDLLNLPYEITRFVKNGLEIKFVKDLNSYTKTVNAFKEFYESIIVTAEDYVYYQKDWLSKLYISYITCPNNIHVHKAKNINKTCKQITNLSNCLFAREEKARYNYMVINQGGILYPPKCFSKEAMREPIFLKYAPNSPDIWFWVMALAQNRKIRLVKNHNHINYIADFQKLFHSTICTNEFNSLLKFYERNVCSKLK